MVKILVIDDDELFCRLLCEEVKYLGYDSAGAFTLKEGLEKCAAEPFDIVFLDVKLPDGNGLEMISAVRHQPSAPEVIVLTGAATADGAELAIRDGAWDYITKPGSMSSIMLPLIRAIEYRKAKRSKVQPKSLILEGIMGRSSKMEGCFELISQASSTDSNTLITGETGTGKELFARAVHRNSSRSEKAFIVVDCASLKDTLAESILFGHEKGAYTGADRGREGLILQSNGGTLFLDEVGELPLSMQRIFLRVLQERRFRPLGGSKDVESDFRLIAATNCDLDKMVHDGTFRSDLFFRLRSIAIEIPPLREHTEDIGEIAIYHAARICRQSNIELKGFNPDFLEALCAYDWPGNIRELVNSIEKAVASSTGEPILFSKHLPDSIRIKLARNRIAGLGAISATKAAPAERSFPMLNELRELSYAQIESKYLRDLLAFTEGDIRKAMEIAGIGRSRLYGLVKKHDISIR